MVSAQGMSREPESNGILEPKPASPASLALLSPHSHHRSPEALSPHSLLSGLRSLDLSCPPLGTAFPSSSSTWARLSCAAGLTRPTPGFPDNPLQSWLPTVGLHQTLGFLLHTQSARHYICAIAVPSTSPPSPHGGPQERANVSYWLPPLNAKHPAQQDLMERLI